MVLLAPALLAPVLHFSRRLRREARRSQERMGEMTTIVDETVKGIRIVQAFTMEAFEAARFRRATQRHFRANLRARAIQAANAPVMEIVGALGTVALIGYAGLQIRAGAMTLGDLSAFLLGVYGAYNPLKRLNKFNLALQQAEVAAQRVFEVVDAPVAIVDRPGASPLDGVGDGVRLERVWFAYEGERWVLEGFDLTLPAGKTLALVGPSGAGKSTVAQLIPRFWDVQRGAVRVGGADVREVSLASLRASVGLVTQETVLFNDTVANNIAFGQAGAPREKVEAAARAAFAHDFVMALADGYDTVIGEAGMKLSGGQRQRLAIARALFKDPPILILDEATSALDPEAERLVQRALDNLMRGRTTLVIAHRLSTVRRADSIVVLDRGGVVEQGRHEELMARGGLYRRLVEMQELKGGRLMSVWSMTGFGRARGPLSERLAVSVVVRSVNHRYFDLQVKINLREEMPEVEAVVREVVNHRLERGRVSAQLVFERSAIGGNRVVVDAVAVQSVLDQLRDARRRRRHSVTGRARGRARRARAGDGERRGDRAQRRGAGPSAGPGRDRHHRPDRHAARRGGAARAARSAPRSRP